MATLNVNGKAYDFDAEPDTLCCGCCASSSD
jgi:hypothetical protein